MGYYTKYEGGIHGSIYDSYTREVEQKAIEHLLTTPYFESINREQIHRLNDLFSYFGHTKWYNHDIDMLELSRQFPDITFYLHGEGEERDDVWDAYYRNGKMATYYAELIFPSPFDEGDLR